MAPKKNSAMIVGLRIKMVYSKNDVPEETGR